MKGIANPGIREMFHLAAEARSGGIDVVNLTAGDPDFPTPPHIVETAKSALDQGFTHYPPHVGLPELREALAAKLRKENHIDVTSEEILVNAGSGGAGVNSILATIKPGDEVIITDPAFYNYKYWVLLAEGKPVEVPLSEADEFRARPEKIEAKITHRTKMIVLNSPSNPTGAVFTPDEIKRIAEIAIDHDLLVMTDEVYERILYDNAEHLSIASLPGMKERTFTINSLSKTYAMTGWRVGYLAADKRFVEEIQKLNIFNAGYPATFIQKAAVAAIQGLQDSIVRMVDEYNARRIMLVEGLNRAEISCRPPKGAIYVFASTGRFTRDSVSFAKKLLMNLGIATVPGVYFGEHGEGYLRVSLSCSRENISKAIARLEGANLAA